jgi:hypothetical protein
VLLSEDVSLTGEDCWDLPDANDTDVSSISSKISLVGATMARVTERLAARCARQGSLMVRLSPYTKPIKVGYQEEDNTTTTIVNGERE